CSITAVTCDLNLVSSQFRNTNSLNLNQNYLANFKLRFRECNARIGPNILLAWLRFFCLCDVIFEVCVHSNNTCLCNSMLEHYAFLRDLETWAGATSEEALGEVRVVSVTG
ncbi:hypothetical protein evm_015075, partial [Chilo suppressalis]